MNRTRAVLLVLAAGTIPAGGAALPSAAPHEVPLPPVEMRPIEPGKSLPIDLDAALALAVAKNIDLLTTRARLDEARGQRNEALGYLVPEYRGSFTAGRVSGRIQASFGDLETHRFNTYLPAATVGLTLNPARAIFDVLAAHRNLAAAEQEREQATQDVLASAAIQYAALQEAQARVAIAEQAMAASHELVRIGSEREQLGTSLKVDVARAEARGAADEGRLAEARMRLRNASVQLALTLRLDPTITLYPLETVVRQQTLVDPTTPLDELTARALASRPDLAAQARRVAAADDRHTAAWAGAIGPTFSGAAEESAIGDRLGNLRDRQIYSGFIGIRLSPASIGQVQAATARAEQARLAAERLEQQVVAEAVTARDGVLTAAEQIEAALRGLRAAEAAAELSQIRYQGGVDIGLEVLDAQTALSEARVNVITAIVAYKVNSTGRRNTA